MTFYSFKCEGGEWGEPECGNMPRARVAYARAGGHWARMWVCTRHAAKWFKPKEWRTRAVVAPDKLVLRWREALLPLMQPTRKLPRITCEAFNREPSAYNEYALRAFRISVGHLSEEIVFEWVRPQGRPDLQWTLWSPPGEEWGGMMTGEHLEPGVLPNLSDAFAYVLTVLRLQEDDASARVAAVLRVTKSGEVAVAAQPE
jgi:hypothetical protein